MKLRSSLLSAAAAIGLGAVALPAAAVDYLLRRDRSRRLRRADLRHVVADASVGAGVEFKVSLDPEFNFVTTGNHFVFSFNGTGVSAGRHRQDHRRRPADLHARRRRRSSTRRSGPSSSASPARPDCSNGGSGGGYNDPLTFTVANASIGDFLVLSTGAGSLGPAYFAADVVWIADTQSFGATGAIGVTTTPCPSPRPTRCSSPASARWASWRARRKAGLIHRFGATGLGLGAVALRAAACRARCSAAPLVAAAAIPAALPSQRSDAAPARRAPAKLRRIDSR